MIASVLNSAGHANHLTKQVDDAIRDIDRSTSRPGEKSKLSLLFEQAGVWKSNTKTRSNTINNSNVIIQSGSVNNIGMGASREERRFRNKMNKKK
jgi:hypothetical protein